MECLRCASDTITLGTLKKLAHLIVNHVIQ